MRTGRGRLAVLAAVGVLVLAGAGSAPAKRRSPAERAERVLEALLVWRLVDELDLSEEQVCRVLPALRALKHARLSFVRRRLNLQREIRLLLSERPVDRDRVEAKLRELRTAQQEFQQQRLDALERIRATLNADQRVRFALIRDSFEREPLSLLADVERFVHERGGPGRP